MLSPLTAEMLDTRLEIVSMGSDRLNDLRQALHQPHTRVARIMNTSMQLIIITLLKHYLLCNSKTLFPPYILPMLTTDIPLLRTVP